MINRERLLAISELKLADKIEQMEEGKLANYVQLLNSFTDNLPGFEKKIKAALVVRDNNALTKDLTQIRDMLKKIYADDMAQDCTKHLGWFGSEKHEKIEAYIRYFLSSLAMLSADIQKAERQTDAPSDDAQKSAAQTPAAVKPADELIENKLKERLLEISELKIAGKIEKMEKEEFNNYIRLLDKFTDNFPTQEENIKQALKDNDNGAFIKHLTLVREILEEIHADEMAQDCAKQIGTIDNTTHEKLEAYIRYFLSTLSMLSIDIQMAQHKMNASALPAKKAANDGPKTDKRILAVDDTVFFLTILKKILQDTRYKLTCVASGRDALKYLEKNQPDIFLLDIEMPGMDGYELAAKIKENGSKAPIIFLTGNARKEHLAKAVEAGAVDFIIKPINKDILLDKICKYLV
ncbi:MAG: response regulator [Treponema sp.]|jgi:CheY-like chemotaxis protein|nr:response regulator [Treponema sp.]